METPSSQNFKIENDNQQSVELELFNEQEIQIPAHCSNRPTSKNIEANLVGVFEEIKQNPDYVAHTPKPNHKEEIKKVRASILGENSKKIIPLTLQQRNQKILFAECGYHQEYGQKFPPCLQKAFLNIQSYEK